MARIAEDVLLLLLDNPEGQPRLERLPLARVLAAALILDLAFDCRVRPTLPDEPLPPGHLVALAGPIPLDPSVRPALRMLEQRPTTPSDAIAAIGKHSTDDVLDQLLRTGQTHQIQLTTHRLRRNHYRWPVKNRGRVAVLRSELIGALFEGRTPGVVNTAVIATLNAVTALGAVLELNDAGVRAVSERAGEIVCAQTGSDTAEVNLTLTLAALLPALAGDRG